MKLFTPNQRTETESRVAITPAVVKRMVQLGLSVAIEAGAGEGSHASDADYQAAGATVVDASAAAATWSDADLVALITPPTLEQAGRLKPGSLLFGMLSPMKQLPLMQLLADRHVTAFAMEFIPRITRAQSMDVLSSQASLGGYVAVTLAAVHCPKLFPMMMTAAGTLAPAKVLVIGAGVAGLQAIATAKRLGAVVEAYDIRPEVKEQIQSLGARFVELPRTAAADTSNSPAAGQGGYARQQTDDERQQQAALMAKHVIAADCVITTAAVFGKAPPMLIPADVANQMAPQAVLIDMAADHDAGRGNCELTKPGQTTRTDRGTTLIGELNLPGRVPVHASQAYAANAFAFVSELIRDQQLALNLDDEIQAKALMTHAGEVRNDMVNAALNPTASAGASTP